MWYGVHTMDWVHWTLISQKVLTSVVQEFYTLTWSEIKYTERVSVVQTLYTRLWLVDNPLADSIRRCKHWTRERFFFFLIFFFFKKAKCGVYALCVSFYFWKRLSNLMCVYVSNPPIEWPSNTIDYIQFLEFD